MTEKNPTYGIIVLAAGGSSRLGRPKQLLKIGNKTLLDISVEAALNSIADHVIVIIGHQAELIHSKFQQSNVQFIENSDWRLGMASSIRVGLDVMTARMNNLEGVICMVCDQPFISSTELSDLISVHEKSQKPIVASRYKDTNGVPAFFHKSFFDQLNSLEGDIGARRIIAANPDELALIDFPKGYVDIDTEEDYQKLEY